MHIHDERFFCAYRTGKVKGIDRFLGTMDNLEPHLIEVTSGEAKYEHHHRAVVWRMSRLPKEGQGTIYIYFFFLLENNFSSIQLNNTNLNE